MTQRRLTALAAAACAVLLFGLYIRGRLERTDQPPTPAPPSEASALQQLSQEGLLRRTSSFVSERATEAGRFVVYVPQSGASGVRWRADTVLSLDSARVIRVSRAAAGDSSAPPVRILGDSVRNDWVLLVGRSERGGLLSVAGLLGGRARTRCGTRVTEELLVNVPLLDPLAGAGLFDLDGALVGMVVRCGVRLAAVPARQITALLASDSLVAGPDVFGLSLGPLDEVGRRYFGTDSGAVVTAVRKGGPAESAGLRPGDVVLSIDGRPIASPSDLTRAVGSRADSAHLVVRLRGRTTADIRLGPHTLAETEHGAGSETNLGIEFTRATQPGIVATRVMSGSGAYAAGMRSGDRITRIGTTDVTSPASAERLLRSASRRPTFIVFERDSVERGVLVQP